MSEHQIQTEQLLDRDTSVQHYDDRYRHGYMDEWPEATKARVRDLVRGLPLPATGRAIDFGCGNGVFTRVLKEALPRWEIWGSELSPVAVENARQRHPDCRFIVAEDTPTASPENAGAFDFLFTHHVLEHVHDLPGIWRQMDSYLKPAAAMLHILPCGNRGSFEDKLCRLRTDGIDPRFENRFFFEVREHLRRLDTERLSAVAVSTGFQLAGESYAHQHWGALDWISNQDPQFINDLTDPEKAVDSSAAEKLLEMRRELTAYHVAKKRVHRLERILSGKARGIGAWLKFIPLIPRIPGAIIATRKLRSNVAKEWEARKGDRAGSEMFLFFRRG